MVYLYILTLSQGRYYVGKSNTPSFRIETHLKGKGAAWCKKYPVLSYDILEGEFDAFDEDKKTKELMKEHGIGKVRGGSYCQIKLSAEQITLLQRELLATEDRCFRCGKKGHFITSCPVEEESEDEESEEEEEIPCTRCGRNSHVATACYAKTTLGGRPLPAPGDKTKAGKQRTTARRVVEAAACARCGRGGHAAEACYAKFDRNGVSLSLGDDVPALILDLAKIVVQSFTSKK